jgi:hypothetical protein
LHKLRSNPELASLDDRYPLRHLPEHLHRANRSSDLHALLTCQKSPAESPGSLWADLHDRAGTLNEYLTQVNLARRVIEHETDASISNGRPANSLATEMTYAILGANVVSRSSAIPGPLNKALLRAGSWDPERALAHAQRQHDPAKRANTLTSLIPHLPDAGQAAQARADALAAVTSIQNESQKAEALKALADHLTSSELDHALHVALAIDDDFYRAKALAGLAPFLSPIQRDSAIEATATINPFLNSRAEVLIGLAPYLSPVQLDAALQAAETISDDWYRAKAFTQLLPYLNGSARDRALRSGLQAATAITDKKLLSKILAPLAAGLGGDYQDRAINQALKAATAIEKEEDRGEALADVVSALGAVRPGWGLGIATTIGDDWYRAWALTELLPNLDGEKREGALSQAIEAAARTEDPELRSRAFARLGPYLSGPARDRILDQALDAVPAIVIKLSRAAILATLAPNLSTVQLGRAAQIATEIDGDFYRAWALTELGVYANGASQKQILDKALEATTKLHGGARVSATADLAPHLDPAQLDQALQAATGMWDEESRLETLAALAPDLSATQLEQALNATTTFEDENPLTDTLIGLAPHLNGPARESVLDRALAAAIALKEPECRAMALAGLAPYLNAGQLNTALQAAAAIMPAWRYRKTALTGLVPYLSGPAQSYAVSQALQEQIEELSGVVWDTTALTVLAPHLNSTQLEQALQAVIMTKFRDHWVDALPRLAPYLSAVQVNRLLETTIADGNEDDRAWMLNVLAPYLATAQLDRALESATAIRSDRSLSWALTGFGHVANPERGMETCIGLAPYLSSIQLDKALQTTMMMGKESYRFQSLVGMISYLKDGQLDQAVESASTFESAGWRAVALSHLASHVNDRSRERVLELALEAAAATNDQDRADALANIIPHLKTAQLNRALELVDTFKLEWPRLQTLTCLVPHLYGPEKDRILDHTLHYASIYPEEKIRAEALVGLATQLDAAQLDQALQVVVTIKNEEHRTEGLAGFAPYLTIDQIDNAAAAVLDLSSKFGIIASSSIFARVCILAEEMPAQRIVDTIRRFYYFLPPFNLLLKATVASAAATAKCGGPEVIAHELKIILQVLCHDG